MAKYNKSCAACNKNLLVPSWNLCYECSATLKKKGIWRSTTEVKYKNSGSSYALPFDPFISDINYASLTPGVINKLEAMGIPIDYVDTVVIDEIGSIIGYRLLK